MARTTGRKPYKILIFCSRGEGYSGDVATAIRNALVGPPHSKLREKPDYKLAVGRNRIHLMLRGYGEWAKSHRPLRVSDIKKAALIISSIDIPDELAPGLITERQVLDALRHANTHERKVVHSDFVYGNPATLKRRILERARRTRRPHRAL